MADDWEFDFLPAGLGYTDLADPQQTHEPDQGLRDPWFEVAHPELFADWRRASRGRSGSLGGRRLSGMARRCSNQGPNAAAAMVAAGACRGSGVGGAGKENHQQQHQPAGLMGPPPPKEPPRKSMGAKRSRAHMSGAQQQAQPQQQYEEEMDGVREEEAYYMEEEDSMDVDEDEAGGGRRGAGAGYCGRGGGAVDDHAMRQRLEEFRMAKQMGKVGGARHLQPTKSSSAAAAASHGGAAPAGAHLGRKPAVPRQAQRGNVAASGPSSIAATKPRLAASGAAGHHVHKGGAAAASAAANGRNGVGGAGAGKRGASAAAAAAAAAEDEEMKALVARHNKKFKPAAPAYVPTLSIRDTRKWEEMTGKSYRALNYAEREQANNEIKAMKAAEAGGRAGGRGR